ncbi:MAG: hypothetical protein F6J92_03305 [Symploca sp. SIO1A3]|nr:hypothetical protein [Symploca sp. SIO1A3]
MSKKKSSLGSNPLAQGIFNKTDDSTNQESRIKNQESSFLNDSEKEKVNLRLPIELNDWLDELLKQGKRKHGQKIAKEIWVQAALELLRSAPVDWLDIDSEETLRSTLSRLESSFKNQE